MSFLLSGRNFNFTMWPEQPRDTSVELMRGWRRCYFLHLWTGTVACLVTDPASARPRTRLRHPRRGWYPQTGGRSCSSAVRLNVGISSFSPLNFRCLILIRIITKIRRGNKSAALWNIYNGIDNGQIYLNHTTRSIIVINVNIQTRDSRAVWTVDRMEAGVDLRDEVDIYLDCSWYRRHLSRTSKLNSITHGMAKESNGNLGVGGMDIWRI